MKDVSSALDRSATRLPARTTSEREAFVYASLGDLAGTVEDVLGRWAWAMPRRAVKALTAAAEQAKEALAESKSPSAAEWTEASPRGCPLRWLVGKEELFRKIGRQMGQEIEEALSRAGEEGDGDLHE